MDRAGSPEEEVFEESKPFELVSYYILYGSFRPSDGKEEKLCISSITVKSLFAK